MNDFVVSGRIEADSSKAETALKKTGTAAKGLSGETSKLGQSNKRAAGDTQKLTNAEQQAAAAAKALAAANERAKVSANGVAQANNVAGGSIANLGAQYNDTFVMLVAGQNPIQLALQQGTQINQVLAQMRTGGMTTGQALSSAFTSVVNPANLMTLGVIAGGAAIAQLAIGALSASKDTKTFEEHLQNVSDATERYAEFADLAVASTEDLEERFGSASGAVRSTLQMLERLAASEAQTAIDGVARATAELLAVTGDGDRRMNAAELFDVNIGFAFGDAQREARKEARGLTSEFVNQSELLAQSTGDIDAQISALTGLIAVTERLSDASGGRNAQEEEMLTKMAEALLVMHEQRGVVEDVATTATHAYKEYYDSRITGEEYLANARERELEALAEIYGQYARLRTENEAEVASANDLLATMHAKNELQLATLQYGADSAEVAELRAKAERDAFEELLASKDISEDLKDQLRAAFEAGQDLAAVDISTGLAAASAEAKKIAQNLGIALHEATSLMNMQSDQSYGGRGSGDFEMRDRRGEADPNAGRTTLQELLEQNRPERGGGGGAAEKERDAVADLTKSLSEQLELLRETDPVQQEMIRNREALSGATAAERAEVEALIETRHREQLAMELAEQTMQEWKDLTYDTFDELISSGGDLEQVFNSLTGSLLKMVQQALLLGEGPLAGLFGTSGGGGLISSFVGALTGGGAGIPAKAEGGMIYGPGSGTSDDVLMFGSSGEFVMNARATARNRHVLEAMNAGAEIQGFAKGGAIGGGASSGGGANVQISVDNQGSTPVRGQVEERPDGAGGRKYTLVLADQVGAALGTRGGGAKRTLRQQYGVTQRGSKR